MTLPRALSLVLPVGLTVGLTLGGLGLILLLTHESIAISENAGVVLLFSSTAIFAVAFAGEKLFALYFRIKGRHADFGGSVPITRNTTLRFSPILIKGLWRIYISISDGHMTAEIRDASNPDAVHLKMVPYRRRILRGCEIWADNSGSEPLRFTLDLNIEYSTPVEMRSLRLARELHGQPLYVNWRITIDGKCESLEFPCQPSIDEKIEGFPVLPVKGSNW